ncbi:MAG: hypothetical protein U0791_12430 [Gemmataceae bacterium]
MLLLGGILLFGGVYGFYARVLGWMDGLPQLPAKMLAVASSDAKPPEVRTSSPTIERIREAFGPDCLEQKSAFYPTQLEFRSGATSTVLACGSPPFNGTNRVALAPFSVAQFGAPKPPHQRQDGEAQEITTFHADKAILEFDRPVNGPTEMGKAKLLRMELLSEPPEPAQVKLDRRSGTIHITHNQRSKDPAKFLVVRTVGPMFYRDPKQFDPKSHPGGPDIWTDAAIEIVDRNNLPRRVKPVPEQYRTFAFADRAETAPAPANLLQAPQAVFEVLEGMRLPPPTATAIGLKVFLDSADSPKKNNNPLGNVKRVELLEKVLLNLWTEADQGLANTGGAKAAPGVKPAAAPTLAAVALGGPFLGVEAIRKLDRSLLQIDTLGRLAYDTEKNSARFDVLPDGNPDLPNDVQVHRVPPLGLGTQRLFSQILEIEFGGPPVGPQQASASTGLGFRRLRAWVELANRFVTLVSDADHLEAYGQYLLHDKDTETTTLRGLPLTAVRKNDPQPGKKTGSHILTAGSKERPAILTLKPGPAPDRSMTAAVDGAGRFELFDSAAGANNFHASWKGRMTVTKEILDRRPLDVFTFIDEGKFEDKSSGFWLKGKELRLWMEPKDLSSDRGPAFSGKMQPGRLQALGDVTSRSAELEIEQSDSLNVLFRDGIAPLQPMAVAAATPVAAAPQPGPPMPMIPAVTPIEPVKAKQPLKLRARTVDTWMVRYPATAAQSADGGMKYELDKARCEGNVFVTQEPSEPGPDKRGLEVRGHTLLADHTPDGSVLTVSGLDEANPGQVHHDGMSIIGAKIVLDQLHNTADVDGRGSLVLPATSNLAGSELKQSSPVVIHWRDFMKFKGADRWAEFQGKVSAKQNESFVLCHIMQVRTDKPVDFSRRAKPGTKNDAKIESVRCYPAPEDLRDEPKDAYWVTYEDAAFDETGKAVKRQRMVARELELTAKAFEPGNRDPHQRVVAAGPGTIRILQAGVKDEAAPQPKAPDPAAKEKEKEQEMKLTIVHFAGRMIARDFGSIYQDATFQDSTDLMHVPADHIDAAPDRNKLPAGSMRLQCAERLVVSSHKKPGQPTVQRLDGYGNAYIRSDQYDGWGESVSSDGPLVTLRGGMSTLALITNRYDNTRTSGQVLVYNRVTGAFNNAGSAGGTIQTK